MIFTDCSEFKGIEKVKEFDTKENERNKIYILKLKDGTELKQITKFEESTIKEVDSIKASKYGAWFTSDKDAIFMSPQEITEIISK